MIKITSSTQAIFYNHNAAGIQRMLDYDYLIGRTLPSVAVIVHPIATSPFAKYFFGAKEILIPVVRTLQEACMLAPQAQVLINFASLRSAVKVVLEAADMDQFQYIHVFAEGIPERAARQMAAYCKLKHKILVGPASMGFIFPGKFKTAHLGGTIENIKQTLLYRPGSVGLVTRSGGLFNELAAMIGREADGLALGMAIGGDRFAGSFYLDHLLEFEHNPDVKYSVILGEVGGSAEYEVIRAIKDGCITKPVIAYCIGTSADRLKVEVQFGHAGASKNAETESASAKNLALSEVCGVPQEFDGLAELIRGQYEKLELKTDQTALREVPLDLKTALKQGLVRVPTHFTTSIVDDRGEEVLYSGQPLSELVDPAKGYSFVDVLSLLWFKRRFPKWAADYLQMVMMLIADHGPLVSGAHNSIVAARAGKDLVSSLASGLLTIGPRFGGAIDEAARNFRRARLEGLSAQEFVNQMGADGRLILGIGHKTKSLRNPDKRVESLIQFAEDNFASLENLKFARQVEKITTAKKENLILNVDGTIAALFLDMWAVLDYSEEEIGVMIDSGVLNAFFVLSRSTGLIGHILDQKRLGSGLYRHPQEDVLYID